MQSIEDYDFKAVVAKAQKNLNDSYRHYKSGVYGLAQEFIEIKLQVCIFQYDVCVEMTNVLRNQPTGFAAGVALKGLVLRIFEFDLILRGSLLPRLLALAKERDIDLGDNVIRLKRDWKLELRQLQGWHHVRNHAAGHYDLDLQKQVTALEELSVDKVFGVSNGFLSFAQGLFKILRDAGNDVAST
ncbi:hypothetical protein [Janthinobacterium sp.]|uniref:hypothetical protein n=1 Tax=Janthinobacterium sp. TaxID=1871054 RepID=UPI0025C44D06|nr:hypothetical protein [Janthinobacterium sp.]